MGTLSGFSLDETVDAVVIGLGAGGSPLLARLAEAGLMVVGLEAGKWHRPSDFATDEVAQQYLVWNQERLSAGSSPIPFGSNNSGTGVGGSTLHYTAYVPRAQPDDFRLFTEFGVGRDWPLSFDDLAPYYEEVEWTIGVSGPSPYPWGPSRPRNYPLPPLPLNSAAQIMERACSKVGIRTSPAANAALSADYAHPLVGHRFACINRGFCQAGCRTGAKGSMDVTYIPMAVRNGAEIRAECFVRHIQVDKGRVKGVIYSNGEGKELFQRCRHLFLSAGAIETPRILLNNGICNGSGQLGKNFMAHVGVQVWGQFEEEVRPWKGIPGGLISEDMHRPKGVGFAGGYLLQSLGVMPITYVQQLVRGKGLFGQVLTDHMSRFNHVAGINVLGECLPSPNNYLELSQEMDEQGLPKPRIHFSEGENERAMGQQAETLMRELWSDAEEIWSFKRFAHTIGTCRMGDDPADSVVDGDGRCHEIPNLTICDNSIFPSAMSVNPALTIMALSLRTADRHLLRGI